MQLLSQAAVGQLTNSSTGAGTWSLFTQSTFGTVDFGSQFSNVTQIYIADPAAAGGTSTSNCWDDILLSTCPQENRAPSISCPQPVQVECNDNSSSNVTLTASIDDLDGDALTVTWFVNGTPVETDGPTTASSVSMTRSFPLGASTVSVEVSDGELGDDCSTTVTVVDTTHPIIICADDVVVGTDLGECFATLDLNDPMVSDTCDVVSVVSNAPATFPIGTTTVTWTVTDAGNNESTCTQTVTVLDLEAPVITCPDNVSVVHDAGTCVATGVALGSATATDNCGVDSISDDAPSTFDSGTTVVTWTATDEAGNSTQCFQLVEVTNQGPTAVTDGDRIVECTSTAGATVTLDGSGSNDPDDPFGSLDFQWSAVNIDFDDDGMLPIATAVFPMGSTTVSLQVTDPCGAIHAIDVIIVVEDTTAPQIQAAVVDTKVIWPPNHKMVPIAFDLLVRDTCENPEDLILACTVSSDEPDDENGDGAFTGDVDGQDGFTSPVSVTLSYNPLSGSWQGDFLVRAERDGRQDGRKYSISCVAMDDSGNMTAATVCVTVPHNKKGGR